ncbi:hypothetical protein SETIT_3G093200v2 [Setaria italica]|uniref:KAT8 regulatory NSL complex subunit 2 n=1 Tax=Setaria italica TaxID=4555 RepID=K3Z8Z5_SETIT|nr:uncharacterized protein LOC101779845 [Setaria italica]RCV15874.1 hypothetical protein SETIT_3G093200v2 [Setaria italica]
MDEPQPPPLPPRPPLELAGAARDAELRLAAALSREEVLRRRRRRLLQLCSLYRAQFWALADELPARHGEYWWEHGASPALGDEPPPSLRLLKGNGAGAGPPENGGLVGPLENGCRGAVAPAAAAAGGRAGCAASNCEAKAMPLSLYCFNHILLDPKQQLYQPCAFPTRKSGMPNGEAICGNPVLRGITPLRCADHDPKSQKLIIEALKNAGIDLPLTSKSVPKLSLLISETVREIQMKRKFSMNAGKTAPSDMSLK